MEKLYSVSLPAKNIETVYTILKNDLSELTLDEDELLFRCAVCNAFRKGYGYISFELYP